MAAPSVLKMAVSTNNTWVNAAKKIEFLTSKPENFLKPQHAIAEDIKKLIKGFYDSVKCVEEIKPKHALPELIIENFDDEQIWQELELQNNEKFEMFVPQVAKFMASKNKLLFPIKKDSSESNNKGKDSENEDSQSSGSESDELRLPKAKQKKKKRVKQKPIAKPSIVDDKFFKLREMEVFLEQEERSGEKPVDSDDESIDLFVDEPSDDDDEGDDEEEAEDPGTEEAESFGVHYKDFFDPVEGEEEVSEEDGSSIEESEPEEEIEEEVENYSDQDNGKKKVRFETGLSDDSDDSEEAEEGPKSSFETRQARLQQKIEKIHEDALGEKPWQLQGEVSATTRPQNSLLEEVLEFDTTTRPAPVITEETTLKLEDVIRQRIKDKVWDDVERKVKPVETPAEYKKALVLDQEKSKLSLSQIYEQEFLKKQKALETTPEDDDDKQEVDSPEQIEIKKMMHSLFSKLDALSNYHYTPRTPAPEVKVISNLPAITVEEVAPVTASDATLLAPEEVKGKPKGGLLSKEERSTTDKKRERRRKKKTQKWRKAAHEKKALAKQRQSKDSNKKMSKEQAAKHVEQAAKQGTIKKLDDAGGSVKAVKSSTAFFSQLQDEVSSLIKNKTQAGKRKSPKDNTLNIKKFKL